MTNSIISPEQFYTSEEISEYLNLSLRTVQRLLRNQLLNAYKIHGQYRIKGIDLIHYLEKSHQGDTEHVISVISFAPELEKKVDALLCDSNTSETIHFWQSLRKSLASSAQPRVLLCKPKVRRILFSHLNRKYPDITVLSYLEISEDYSVKSVQTLSFDV